MQTIGDHPRVCGEEARSVGRGVAHRGSPPRVRGKGCVIHFSCPPYGITPACAGKRREPTGAPAGRRDHPRVCGEKVKIAKYFRVKEGSPPRVRGKAAGRRGGPLCRRITPACAGKSLKLLLSAFRLQDHPRVCGEKAIVKSPSDKLKGSPPRVRGKGLLQMAGRSEPGITPACAGKRAMDALPSFPAGDHPRVCGEKAPRHLALCCILGSPPRVRGKARHLVRGAVKRGITPACAGKSRVIVQLCMSTGDHPRVCGEKRTAARLPGLRSGSPPRVRGKASGPPRSSGPGGITPACAGKSLRTRCADLTAGDHPRVCGEKAGMGVQHHKRRGSPPRVRGKVFYYPRQSRKKRITPACAGKRQSDRVESKHPLDHPRVCGEKSRLRSRGSLQRGSPPRVRGKVTCTGSHADALGITPACAGKS